MIGKVTQGTHNHFDSYLFCQYQLMVEVIVQGWIVNPASYPTHIPFVPCQSCLPFLRYGFWKIWHNIEIQVNGRSQIVRSHSWCNTLATEIPFIPCHSAIPFLGYSHYEIWLWKSWMRENFKVTNDSDFLSSHAPFVQCQWPVLFLGYSFFLFEKSKVKIIAQIT